MTIDQYVPRAEVALQTAQDVAIHRLGEWARSADAAHQIAQTLVQTSFCPGSFRGKPGEATAAILAGLEVGLQPMAALRSFDVIQGQAAARAITLRAIVQSHGHELILTESTATRCRMKGRRKGSEEWQTVTWTIDRARDMQLTGKDNWKKQPAAMLVARATSELARLIASDAILGIGYSAEEVADGAGVDAPVDVDASQPQESGARRMRRSQAGGSEGSQAETLVVEGEAGSIPADDPSESPLLNTSSALAKRMYATFNEAGIGERDDRLKYVSDVVGREVASSSEMTDADASAVLDALARDFEPQPDDPWAKQDGADA